MVKKTVTSVDEMSKVTPLMAQYFKLKAKHPDAILLYRVGDFYETFAEDAIKVAEILVSSSPKEIMVVMTSNLPDFRITLWMSIFLDLCAPVIE